jgi:hypothetical protein
MLLSFIAEMFGLLHLFVHFDLEFSQPLFLNFSGTLSFLFDKLLSVLRAQTSFCQQALINVRSLANFRFQPQELR